MKKLLICTCILFLGLFLAALTSCGGGALQENSDVEVVTVAGSGETGTADGSGIEARFKDPDGVTVTNSGVAYITDMGNHEVRRIAEDGTTTTIAGSGTAGYVDGAGAAAQFNTPDGITTDSGGNVFIADAGNNVIRKVTPEGVVSTFAGTGVAGNADGGPGEAQFNFPTGITVDAADNLYVSDQDNNIVRKITPGGEVTTIAGTGEAGFADGAGADAQFDKPHGIAIDPDTNALFVTDQNNHRVRQIDADGDVATVAGNGTAGDVDGPPAVAEINVPHGITVADNGDVYFADEASNKIRVVDTLGEVSHFAGTGSAAFADGAADEASFNTPRGLTITQSGDFLVCDYTNQRVRKIIVDANEAVTIAGTGAAGDTTGSTTSFSAPESVFVAQDGSTIVADAGNNKIKSIDETGVGRTLAGVGEAGFADGAAAIARFDNPSGVVTDSNQNVYVADTGNSSIRRITPEGIVTTFAGDGAAGNADGDGSSARFDHPTGLAIDAGNNLYVADQGNDLIRKISHAGEVTTIAGTGAAGFADGAAAAAQFNAPKNVAVDAGGNVYVADAENDRIRKITPGGEVTTIAGNGTAGFADGPVVTSQVNNPQGVVADAEGNVYFSEEGNDKIREISAAGKVTTIAGTGQEGFVDDDKAKKSKFNDPQGLALGHDKQLIVADTGNNSVRAIEKRNP